MFRLVRVSMSLVLCGLLIAAVALPVQAALPVKKPPCGKVVTKSFKLGRNMNCTGDGLIVGKRGITIHLNGKRIRGDGDVDDVGILNEGYRAVTIRNGRVVNFEDGIKLVGAVNNTVKRVRAIGNAEDGVEIQSGRGNLVSFVVANGNGNDGIDLATNRATLLDTISRNSGDHGIEAQGNNNVLRRNYACGSASQNYNLIGTFISTKNTEDAVC